MFFQLARDQVCVAHFAFSVITCVWLLFMNKLILSASENVLCRQGSWASESAENIWAPRFVSEEATTTTQKPSSRRAVEAFSRVKMQRVIR